MDTTIEQQAAMDEALAPHAQRRTRSSSDISITPPTAAAGPRLTSSQKGKQAAKTSKAKSLSALFEMKELVLYQGFPMYPLMNESDEETKDEESFDPIPQTPENSKDKGNGEEDLGLNIGEEERHVEEEEEDKLYRDVKINQGRGIQANLEVEDSHVTLTPVNPDGQQQSSSVSSQFVTSMESISETTSQLDVQTPTSMPHLPMTTPTMTPSTIATITTSSQVPILPTIVSSNIIQNLPNFGSLFRFDDRLRSLEVNFSEAMQTNQFAGAVSVIPEIVYQYMDQQINEAVKVAVQIQSDRLCDEAQRDNDEFLKTIDENMQKIIKEQQLEAEVLTRSSHSSRTSYVVADDLSEMELKKILIEKIEGNKSIQRSDEQRNLYKALIEAYKFDKIILDTYEETVTLKRRRDDDADKDENPSLDQTGGQRDAEKERSLSQQALQRKLLPGALAGLHKGPDLDRRTEDQPIIQSSQHPEWFSQQQKPPYPDRDWSKTVPAVYGSIQPWISDLAKQADTRSYFNELMDTPLDFSNFLINWLKVDTLTPDLLADQLDWVNPEGQQYPHNLLKPLPLIPKNRGRCVIPFEHFINNDLEYLCGGAFSRKYTTLITKTKAADYGHIKWIEDLVLRTMWIEEPIGYDKHALWGVSHWGRKRRQFYDFAVNQESARDVYSKRRIIIVTELKIVEWHTYKHLDWITPELEGYPLVSVEVLRYDKRSKSENKGIVPTEMELILEHTQQGRNRVNTYAIRNTKLLSGIEDNHHVPSDAMHNPSKPLKVEKTLFQNSRRYTDFYRLSHSELVDIEKEALSSSLRSLK
nr:hypothetical protein [Tanacetum cinerariifolium]